MDKYSSDLLKNKKEFSVEKFTYATTVNMPNSHYHDHYEILYIIEGKRKLTVNNAQEYILDSNNIALIKPYIVHGTTSYQSDRQTRILVDASEAFIKEFTSLFSKNLMSVFDFPVITLNAYEKAMVNREMMRLVGNDKSADFEKDINYVCFANILLALTEMITTDEKKRLVSSNNIYRMKDVVQYIDEHLTEHIDLAVLGNEFGLSREYLARSFKKNMGITIVQHITNMRIAKAQRLLENSDISVLEVALTTGFHSQSNFCKVFKKICGISPKEYQKMNKEKQQEKMRDLKGGQYLTKKEKNISINE